MDKIIRYFFSSILLIITFLLSACTPTEVPATDITPLPAAEESLPTPPPVVGKYSYEDGSVMLEIPWQKNAVPLHSEEAQFELNLLDKSVEQDYKIVKPIIHLIVYNDSNVVINEFAPPITLTVQFDLENLTAETEMKIADISQLAILVFDSKADHWIPYLPYFFESDGLKFATISIESWTSPATWGCRGCYY